MNRKKIFSLLIIPALILSSGGCAIKLGPDPVILPRLEGGSFRLGEVTETATGTWNRFPDAGIKGPFLGALKNPEASTFFSGGVSSLVADIHLTTDHEDDGPRLTQLGALSMITLGIFPLKYHSEWNVQCRVTVKNGEGNSIGSYNFTEQGLYEIRVYPLTMFALFGAGMRGASDAVTIHNRMANALVDKMMRTLNKDRRVLTAQAASGGQGAGSFSTLRQNVII
ncbi:MAG TPA: hypothetical protein PKL97_02930 [Candidatus Omnitrophota bacterium]|nr:hypothetical protein [Candidatus Omnitrophota bacterium]